MPQRDTAPVGAPCWVDVLTSDPDRTSSFYEQLFGWTAKTSPEHGGYINFLKDGQLVAGCSPDPQESGSPSRWSIYLAVDDAAATAAAAAAHGGQVLVPVIDVMELGSMAVVGDPGGAAIGLWQPGTHRGFSVFGEPATASWFELLTPDYDASVAFYREVFKWDAHTAQDTPGFRYTTLGEGEGMLAGIMDATAFLEGAPANWSLYFGSADVDATLARAVDLGGSVIQPAEDTPYGRLAIAADSTGAVFKLISR
jgi:predicted enzyme related to lactoylglutathione lyase